MAETAVRADPLPAFRFEVSVDRGRLTGGFSECGGLQVETETMDYAEGGENTFVHKLPVRTKQSTIKLKRGVVDRAMWAWQDDLAHGRTTRYGGSIRILDESGAPVAEWQFFRAFPVKWTGPELNATQSQVAVESLELAHEGLLRST